MPTGAKVVIQKYLYLQTLSGVIKQRSASLLKKGLIANFFKKSLIKNAWMRENDTVGVIKRRNANLLKKGLIKNAWMRENDTVGVIKRRNVCGPRVVLNRAVLWVRETAFNFLRWE
ncbi:hypothetical protein [Methanosarcina sp.]|uniref:hypothetical protein n=1 Tax=Methanosarcina sp. TaxID=2213 RepID=UPI003C7841D9